VTVHGAVHDRLPDPIELAAYFVVSEALTNVAKHASPTEASVLLDQESGVLCVESQPGQGTTIRAEFPCEW
jgi:signal transduction histidine kinase